MKLSAIIRAFHLAEVRRKVAPAVVRLAGLRRFAAATRDYA